MTTLSHRVRRTHKVSLKMMGIVLIAPKIELQENTYSVQLSLHVQKF